MGPDLIAVVGREGGVREQRRFGDVFLLRVDVAAGRASYIRRDAGKGDAGNPA